jgi:hypothetical protein
MNIIYKDSIQLKLKRNGAWFIQSDKGFTYDTLRLTNSKTVVTDWKMDRPAGEQTEWQHGITIGYAWDTFGPLDIFKLYIPGQGYSQPHDMCLCHNDHHGIWIFSTARDYWITHSDASAVLFETKHSLGSILKQEDRFNIGDAYDVLKKEYNPDNLVLKMN